MKNVGHFKLKAFALIVFTIVGSGVAFAQTTSTSTDPFNGLTQEQYIEAERQKYIEAITPKDNPYSNLSDEEYSKLPLSARMPNDIKEQISVDVSPEIPRPGDRVTITVSAYGGIDVNSSVIDWIVDGKSALKGVGKKSFVFTTPGNGVLTNIELRVQPQYGPVVTRTFKFNPSEVDVLWQANTYTPPFYKGKALYSTQAELQFVAMPNITQKNKSKIQPQNTVYNWELEYTPDAEKSGYGVNYFNYTGLILGKPTTVSVTAYDPLDKSATGVGKISLEPIQPLVLLYEMHPTYGTLFNSAAVGTFNFNKDDIQLGAYPLFYSADSKKNVTYKWSINGVAVPNIPTSQDYLVLQKLKQEAGQSKIKVNVSNGDKVMQQSETFLDLLY